MSPPKTGGGQDSTKSGDSKNITYLEIGTENQSLPSPKSAKVSALSSKEGKKLLFFGSDVVTNVSELQTLQTKIKSTIEENDMKKSEAIINSEIVLHQGIEIINENSQNSNLKSYEKNMNSKTNENNQKDIGNFPEIQIHDKFSPIKKQRDIVAILDLTTLLQKTEDPTAKRKRGRPKRTDRVIKERLVTRKSLRIVEMPESSLRAKTIAASANVKPLRILNIDQLLSPSDGSESPQNTPEASAISSSPSFRSKGTNINTLDVLLQYVKEHTPRPKQNDTVNEAAVLSEYKAHLVLSIEHLNSLHLDVFGLSHEISDVQRKKNEVRRRILEIKKKHDSVSSDILLAGKKYDAAKSLHTLFMNTITLMKDLQKTVGEDLKTYGEEDKETNPENKFESSVHHKLEAFRDIFDSEWGLGARLHRINNSLRSMLQRDNEE